MDLRGKGVQRSRNGSMRKNRQRDSRKSGARSEVKNSLDR